MIPAVRAAIPRACSHREPRASDDRVAIQIPDAVHVAADRTVDAVGDGGHLLRQDARGIQRANQHPRLGDRRVDRAVSVRRRRDQRDHRGWLLPEVGKHARVGVGHDDLTVHHREGAEVAIVRC